MADIFISYARADREIAKVFADAFAAEGWSLWWDPEISYGTQFDKVIEQEISRAKCVVVLWSKRSVESPWVRTEASDGNQRSMLVPIRIEVDAKEPLEFRKVQTAELAGWGGDRENPTYQKLLRDIDRVISSEPPAREAHVRVPADQRGASLVQPRRRLLLRLAYLGAPTLIALIVAAIGMRIHRPTPFDLELTVKSLSFVSAAQQNARLLERTAFNSLALHGMESGTLNAKRFVLSNQGQGESRLDRGPQSSPVPVPLRVTALEKSGAAVMLEATERGAQALGEVDRLFVPPAARVDLAVIPEKPPRLSVRIWDQPSRILFSLRGEWLLDLVQAKVESAMSKARDAAVTLKLSAAADGSVSEFTSTVAGPRVILTVPSHSTPPALLPAALRVSALKLTEQGSANEVLSTVSGDGKVGYADAEDRKDIAVKPGDYIVPGDLRNFYIRSIGFQSESGEIRLVAGGVAGSLKSGPPGAIHERAITWFDSVWHQPRSLQLFALAIWLFPTTLAGYKLFKELR
jgi:TIR domain-containing protein